MLRTLTRSSARSMMPTQLSPKSVALMCPLAEMSRLSGLTSLQWSSQIHALCESVLNYIL